MSLENDFETFVGNLGQTAISDMEITVGEIAKKLNKNYYDLEVDKTSHMYIVGSIGRETAIKEVSYLDILFDLSSDKYSQNDEYETNGQFDLLEEVKMLLKRDILILIWGRWISISVVVIKLSKYTVELVLSFKQSDDGFKYLDINDSEI